MLLTGTVVSLAGLVYAQYGSADRIPNWIFWTITGACLLVACFLAWRDEHRARVNAENQTPSLDYQAVEKLVEAGREIADLKAQVSNLKAQAADLKVKDTLGVWQGNKFIYHSKLHVYTVEVSAQHNDEKLLFKLNDPPIGSLVETIIEIDRHDERVRALVLWPHDNLKGDLRGITKQTRSSLRLPKDRTLSLKTYAEPEATPTTIRVFISSWTILADVEAIINGVGGRA